MASLAQVLKSRNGVGGRPVLMLSNCLTKTLAAFLENGIKCLETPDFPGPPVSGGGQGAC